MSIEKVLRGLALVFAIVGILCFVIGAFGWIGIVTDEWHNVYDRPAAYAWFAVTIGGPFLMAIFTSILYGFAKLIEQTTDINCKLSKIEFEQKSISGDISGVTTQEKVQTKMIMPEQD